MHAIAAFAAGLAFGIGLIVSGMANPARVLGFLDVSGRWDPTLLFVIAGAVSVSALGYALARRRTVCLLGTPMQLPTTTIVDARLVLGSLAFGVGWGLAGFCPGPALVALGAGYGKAAVFVAAMLAGMGLYEVVERARAAGAAPAKGA